MKDAVKAICRIWRPEWQGMLMGRLTYKKRNGENKAYEEIIRDGKLVEKRTLKLPERIRGVLKCKNPRCITSVEQELPQVFTLTEESTRTYRCLYCETKAEN